MNAILPRPAPCGKGWVLFALEEISRRKDARDLLFSLDKAIQSAAPAYEGFTEILETYLLAPVAPANQIPKIVNHLQRHWFDPQSSVAFFTGPVAEIYARGLSAALALSQRSDGPPVPITAWWIVDHPDVRMLAFSESDNSGFTARATGVQFLVLTPRPIGNPGRGPFVLRDTSDAWVAQQQDDRVVLREFAYDHLAVRRDESVEALA